DLLTAMTAIDAANRPTAQACALRLTAALEGATPAAGPTNTAHLAPVVSITPDADTPNPDTPNPDTPVGLVAPVTATHRRSHWRLAAVSVAGIAAVVAALAFLIHDPRPLTGHAPATAADSGPSDSTAGHRPGAAGGSTAHGSGPGAGMLVVDE